MDFIFVVPNLSGGKHFLQPPLDVLYDIAHLRASGHSARILDNRVKCLALDELPDAIGKTDAIVVNTAPYDLSQMYHFDYRLAYSIATARAIKNKLPSTPLILSGIHVNVQPGEMMRETAADVALLGETERLIVLVANAMESGSELSLIPNLCVRAGDKYRYTNEDPSVGKPPFEKLLLPAYDVINLGDYYGYELREDRFERVSRWGVMMASRGCPYSCEFCHNFWGEDYRKQTPQKVAAELELLEREHGAKHVFFLDPNFTLDEVWLSTVADEIQRRAISVPWTVQTRIDLVDEPRLISLKRAKCKNIFFGMESYDDGMLKKLNKGITTRQIDMGIEMTRRHGIDPFVFVMLGAPGETKKSMRNTIQFLRAQEVPYIAIVYGPRFGSGFGERASLSSWTDLQTNKGGLENAVSPEELGRVVRFLRKQNVLRSSMSIEGIV